MRQLHDTRRSTYEYPAPETTLGVTLALSLAPFILVTVASFPQLTFAFLMGATCAFAMRS